MPDEIPYPPRDPSLDPGFARLDWDGVRRRLGPSATRLLDELLEAVSAGAPGAPATQALQAALAARLAALEAEFESARAETRATTGDV